MQVVLCLRQSRQGASTKRQYRQLLEALGFQRHATPQQIRIVRERRTMNQET